MQNLHQWKEKTSEGLQKEVRARLFAGRWKIQSRFKGDAFWTVHDPPSLPDLQALREILFNKYRRKRVPYEQVETIDRWLKKLES